MAPQATGADAVMEILLRMRWDDPTLLAAIKGNRQLKTALKDVAVATGAVDQSQKRGILTIAKWALGWKIAYGALNLVSGAVRGSITNLVRMEHEMAQISIVSDQTTTQLRNMERGIRTISKTYGISSIEIAKATKLYVQQGLAAGEALSLTGAAARGALITGQNIGQMVENLTAAQRGYNLTAEETKTILDKWVAVAMHAPVTVQVLADAYRRAGAAAADAGVSVNELNALVSALAGTMRMTGQQAGTSLATIFQRIRRPQAVAALAGVGVEPVSAGGMGFRPMFEMLGDLAGRWDTLTESQRRYVMQQVAGIRRGKDFIALIRSWDKAQQSLTDSTDAFWESHDKSRELAETTLSRWERFKELVVGTVSAMKEGVVVTGEFWQEALETQAQTAARSRRVAASQDLAALYSALDLGAPPRGPTAVGAGFPGGMQGAPGLQTLLEQIQRPVIDAMVRGGMVGGPQDIDRLQQARTVEEFINAATAIARAADKLNEAAEVQRIAATKFGESMGWAAAQRTYAGPPVVQEWMRGTMRALGMPAITVGGGPEGGVPPGMRDFLRLMQTTGLEAPFAGRGAMAGGGVGGAEANVAMARERLQVLQEITRTIQEQSDLGQLTGGRIAAELLIKQLLTKEMQLQIDIVRQELKLRQQIASEIRAAAEVYKTAFTRGLADIITGQGDLRDLAMGLGETAFQRNIESLVDRMDAVFVGIVNVEYQMIKKGGTEAAIQMGNAVAAGGQAAARAIAAATGAGVSPGGGLAGGMAGASAAQLAEVNAIFAAEGIGPADYSLAGGLAGATPSQLADVNAIFAAQGIGPIDEILVEAVRAEAAAGKGAGAGEGAAKGSKWGPKGGLGWGTALWGAMQGYSLSGGRGIGALASGLGAVGGYAVAGQAGAQIGSLLGALFRRGDDEHTETKQRYQMRVEWQNAVLEQLMLTNRNLVGMHEGGTYALPGSYYYRARTNEALAGELEMALRG